MEDMATECLTQTKHNPKALDLASHFHSPDVHWGPTTVRMKLPEQSKAKAISGLQTSQRQSQDLNPDALSRGVHILNTTL